MYKEGSRNMAQGLKSRFKMPSDTTNNHTTCYLSKPYAINKYSLNFKSANSKMIDKHYNHTIKKDIKADILQNTNS